MTVLVALAVSVIASLLATEFTDVAPWLARRLVRWAAYRWSADLKIAAGYAEEWEALVADRPGRLLKLVTGISLAGGAVARAVPRRVRQRRGMPTPAGRHQAVPMPQTLLRPSMQLFLRLAFVAAGGLTAPWLQVQYETLWLIVMLLVAGVSIVGLGVVLALRKVGLGARNRTLSLAGRGRYRPSKRSRLRPALDE